MVKVLVMCLMLDFRCNLACLLLRAGLILEQLIIEHVLIVCCCLSSRSLDEHHHQVCRDAAEALLCSDNSPPLIFYYFSAERLQRRPEAFDDISLRQRLNIQDVDSMVTYLQAACHRSNGWHCKHLMPAGRHW